MWQKAYNYTYMMMMKQDIHATLGTTCIQEPLKIPGKPHYCCTAAVVATWVCLFNLFLHQCFRDSNVLW